MVMEKEGLDMTKKSLKSQWYVAYVRARRLRGSAKQVTSSEEEILKEVWEENQDKKIPNTRKAKEKTVW